MNIQPEELDGLDHEETDVQEVETMVAQVPEVPVMEVPEEPGVHVPEVPDQEFVSTPPIPVVEEPSTQEAEEVEMLDIENDESLVVENSAPKSKTKKVLNYLKSSKKRAILWRAFHVWQLKPHEVAPLSESTHECAACGTVFKGNYCPRCGQPASVGRFSFKKAIQHFLDVWGMGNRSMFRSLRDLVLRPGYMIRDYLSGMQSAYFPPFKMFFILLTFSLIIQQGIDLDDYKTQTAKPKSESVENGKDTLEIALPKKDTMQNATVQKESIQNKQGHNLKRKKTIDIHKSPLYSIGLTFGKIMHTLLNKNPAIFAFLTLMLFSWPLYFFLRRSPNIPDLRFSEFVVTMAYTSNSFTIFSMLGNLLDLGILKIISVIMVFVTLSQFSGYKKRQILGYLLISLMISTICLVLVVLGVIGLISLFVHE